MTEGSRQRARPRLLVVEDEAIVRADLSHTLVELGYEVVASATSGEQAVALALESRPDVVLMDVTLCGQMDGVEASEQIHQTADLPVIFITAHSDSRTLGRLNGTPHAGYLLKPFEEHLLVEMLEKMLAHHEAPPPQYRI